MSYSQKLDYPIHISSVPTPGINNERFLIIGSRLYFAKTLTKIENFCIQKINLQLKMSVMHGIFAMLRLLQLSWEMSIGLLTACYRLFFFSYGNKTKVPVCLPLLFGFDKRYCAWECATGSMSTCLSCWCKCLASILQHHRSSTS